MSEFAKYVDCGGNVWYMGKWYVPNKYIAFGSESIYQMDYLDYPKARYERDVSNSVFRNAGPVLGPVFWGVVTVLRYTKSKLVIWWGDSQEESARMLPYLEYALQVMKDEKNMEYQSNKQLAIENQVDKDYEDLLKQLTEKIVTVQQIIDA